MEIGPVSMHCMFNELHKYSRLEFEKMLINTYFCIIIHDHEDWKTWQVIRSNYIYLINEFDLIAMRRKTE